MTTLIEQPETESCKNGLFNKKDWLDYYDGKIKDGTFIKEGNAEIAWGPERGVTSENLDAFCDALLRLNTHGKMPDRIDGGSESVEFQIYLELFDRDEDYARQTKPRLDCFSQKVNDWIASFPSLA